MLFVRLDVVDLRVDQRSVGLIVCQLRLLLLQIPSEAGRCECTGLERNIDDLSVALSRSLGSSAFVRCHVQRQRERFIAQFDLLEEQIIQLE